jgi:TPP-dependent pyruvate/acetoin dehydrogenase alpha subunit
MNEKNALDAEQMRKIREDILDSIDEELEMALEDGFNENEPQATAEEKAAIYKKQAEHLSGENKELNSENVII